MRLMGAAYRKKALEHHPDKALAGLDDEGDKEAVQQHFLLIQVQHSVNLRGHGTRLGPCRRQARWWLSTASFTPGWSLLCS